ncbi:hypothetical protein FRC04_005226 [Tulasnella sp. 424]|nr:hypothetical protein FRC04_005226 [Tulasnella sp. 424]KAG8963453.1 hypothetical protein FRC05_004726 [Tulasnella sp. 425]
MTLLSVIAAPPNCLISDLVEQAEAELEHLGVAAIDEAPDAVMLSSGLAIGPTTPSLDEDTAGEAPDNAAEGASLIGPEHRSAKEPKLAISRTATGNSDSRAFSESSLSELSAYEGLLRPGGKKRTWDNRKHRASRKEKGSGTFSRRRALYRKALQLATNITPTSLPHSTQGYLGGEDPSPPSGPSGEAGPPQGPLREGIPSNAQPRLLELCRSNYRVVGFTHGPTLFMDASGRIVAWRVGSFGGESAYKRWEAHAGQLTAAVEKLSSTLGSTRCDAGVPRGPHSWAHWGYSFGGGQQPSKEPTSKPASKRERDAWDTFLSSSTYLNNLKRVKDSWETWAPDIFADYEDCHHKVLDAHPSLARTYPKDSDIDLLFGSITVNLGPQTVCKRHKDIKNKAPGGLCAVQGLGPFDSRRGGHLVLHELRVVVEMRPGDIIFFPSAVISHETIPISSGEKRYSLVWYSAGGLFCWRDAGGRMLKLWARTSPIAHSKHQKLGEKRWIDGWKNFSTLADLAS